MTIAVDWDVKHQFKQINLGIYLLHLFNHSLGFLHLDSWLQPIYLSFHTAAPSFEYYVQLRCQCKNKRKIVGDKKCNSET